MAMLVLSRRATQQIAFPSLGISISVVRILGNVVRLGIDAPREIPVLRGELAAREPAAEQPIRAADEHEHSVRNCLNAAVLSLRVAQRQLRASPEESETMIGKALAELSEVAVSLAQCQFLPPRSIVAPRVPLNDGKTGWRALLVEDNDNERQLLAGYLRMSGFEVVEVSDGRSAICYLEEHEVPHVMLLDMNMPSFNGATAVHWIRERERLRSLRIFGVSGNCPSTRANPETEGIDDWIQKPIDPEAVVEQVSRVIARDGDRHS
jgi:carbon storage regulator CsrA